jgi:hypothetical protein
MAKVYVVRTVDGANANMENPSVADFHGLPCLTGNSISPNENSWVCGSIVFVPLAQIVQTIVYESRQQYDEAMQRFARDRTAKNFV